MKKIALISLFFILPVFAQSINDALILATPGYNTQARALGMGNSYYSISDDASALAFNPAGLGLVKQMEFAGGLNYAKVNNDATFLGNTTSASNSSTNLNQLAFVFPFPTVRGSLVFGVGYHQTNDFGEMTKFDGFNKSNTSMIQDLNAVSDTFTIPYSLWLADGKNHTLINGKLQQYGTTTKSGALRQWDFSGAIEASPNFFIGAQLSILTGSYTSTVLYSEEDVNSIYDGIQLEPTNSLTNHFIAFDLQNDLNWDLSGYDFKFGLLYQFKKYGRFGVSIQTPKVYTIDETFSTKAQSTFQDVSYTLDQGYWPDLKGKYDIVTPYVFSAGGSVNYAGLILSADVSLQDYTQTKFENADGYILESDLNALNTEIKNNFRAVTNYNLGAEYTFSELGVRVRGGYFVQQSPYKGDPSSYDKKYVTGGLGFIIDESLALDVAYIHGWWDTHTDNYGYAVSRVYQSLTNNNYVLSFNYRF
jgi:hypothetical protein